MAEKRAVGKTQADQTFDLIRSDILSCRFRPGTKLKINELCGQYGVSLGSVREALSRLGADGLVIAEAQKGYSVSPVSRDDLIDLTRARVEIESLCLASVIEEGDLRWESEVLASFHRLRHLPERDVEQGGRLGDDWSSAHHEFHSTLVRACSSKWLLRTREMLFSQAERYRRLSVPLRREDRDVDAEHHEIVKAVIARDVARAKGLIAEHLHATTAIILKALNDPAEDTADRRP